MRIPAFGLDIDLTSYAAFLVLAAVVVLVLGSASAARRGLDWRRCLACLVFALAATLIGARLLHRALRPEEYGNDASLLISLRFVGLFLYGGLILSITTTPLICRLLRIGAWRLADSVTPAVGLGIALARVGCFLNGCCFGSPTKMPWGISLQSGSSAFFSQFSAGTIGLLDSPLPVHPAQLYEAAAALAGAGLAWWLLHRKAGEGQPFLGFMIFFTAFRLVKLSVMPTPTAIDRWFEPLLYASVIALCTVAVLLKLRRQGITTY